MEWGVPLFGGPHSSAIRQQGLVQDSALQRDYIASKQRGLAKGCKGKQTPGPSVLKDTTRQYNGGPILFFAMAALSSIYANVKSYNLILCEYIRE